MEMKRVLLMKGDSVTLKTRLREKFNHIMWRFGAAGSIIAETDRNYLSCRKDGGFRDRLKLNHQTGSLTINNMRITDTGVYHLEIKLNTETLFKKFIVTVHVIGADDDDGVKRVRVMEGDSVTLNTRLREKFNRMQWRFGDSFSIIAETDGNMISYPLNDTERFRDRLKVNDQTGSLTINNMRVTDSGVYEAQIDYDYWTSYQKQNVTVCGPFHPDPVLSPGEVAAIVFGVLLLVLAAAAVLYCRYKSFKRRRQNPVTDEEKLKLDRETTSVKTTDSGQSDL